MKPRFCEKNYGKNLYIFKDNYATTLTMENLYNRPFWDDPENNGVPVWKQIRAMLRKCDKNGLSVRNWVGYPSEYQSLQNFRKVRHLRTITA